MRNWLLINLRTRQPSGTVAANSWADALCIAQKSNTNMDSFGIGHELQGECMAKPPTRDMSRAEFRQYAQHHYKQRSALSAAEEALWGLALLAPFGGRFIPTPPGDNPYLMRVYLTPSRYNENKFVRLLPRPYLHFFFRGDDDREVHNHPWDISRSLILTGGYLEYRWDLERKRMSTRTLCPGDINVLRRNDFHRVELLTPETGCWTVFLAGSRVEVRSGGDWGFLCTETGKFTNWGDYVDTKY